MTDQITVNFFKVVDTTGKSWTGFCDDWYETIQVYGLEKSFEDDAQFIEEWAEENGFSYYHKKMKVSVNFEENKNE